MAFYELIFIIRQDISTAEVENITSEFIDLISSLGGEIVKKEYWELRPLAYKIKNNKKGHYVFLGISINFEGLQEVNRKMRYREEIIRISAINVKSIDPEPSPILRSQNPTVVIPTAPALVQAPVG